MVLLWWCKQGDAAVTITISSDDPRSIRAIEIAAGAGQWLKCRIADGKKAYGVPSQRVVGRYYLADCQACTCEDFKRHGLNADRLGLYGEHGLCKHILAVRLVVELAKAQQAQPKRRQPLPPLTDAQAARIFGRL
jgi:hypothetical protein